MHENTSDSALPKLRERGYANYTLVTKDTGTKGVATLADLRTEKCTRQKCVLAN